MSIPFLFYFSFYVFPVQIKFNVTRTVSMEVFSNVLHKLDILLYISFLILYQNYTIMHYFKMHTNKLVLINK